MWILFIILSSLIISYLKARAKMQVTINTENKEILEYLELLIKEIEQEKEIPEDVMASFL